MNSGRALRRSPPLVPFAGVLLGGFNAGLADHRGRCGFASVFADLFNDGRIDVVLNNLDRPPRFFATWSRTQSTPITLKLVGQTFLSAPSLSVAPANRVGRLSSSPEKSAQRSTRDEKSVAFNCNLEGQTLRVNFEPQKIVDSTGPDL